MVNNVTKNTFFYKFFKLNLSGDNLSLKQLIQEELSKAIAIYPPQHSKIDSWQQISISLSEKIILLPLQNSSQATIYRCAIAFALANLTQQSSFLVASQLVSSLSSITAKYPIEKSLEIAVAITDSGLIDFYIWKTEINTINGECNLILWLDSLVANLSTQSLTNVSYLSAENKPIPDELFPLQYIYARCSSLLNLGEREQLISLASSKDCYLRWQIIEPSPFQWADRQGKLLFACQTERDLIWQICWILDYLSNTKPYEPKIWLKFTSEIGEVWLNFVAECNFCGVVKQKNPALAIARLGLIALTHWCLEAIFISQLQIMPQKEITF